MLAFAAGCGAGESNAASERLEAANVRTALDRLPYSYALRRVEPAPRNDVAYLGRVHGPHGTVVRFSLGLGEEPIAVPVRGAGTSHAVGGPAFGFVYNDNSDVYRSFVTNAQWREAARMSVAIVESFCRAASGKPCPI